MLPLLGALMPTLTKLGDKVIESVFPDAESQNKARKEWQAQIAQIDQAEIDSFRDFVVAYEGAGDKVHPYLQFLRGSVRPCLTYFLAFAYVYCFVHPTEFSPDTLQQLWQLNLLSMGFWYGERALKNLGLNLKK